MSSELLNFADLNREARLNLAKALLAAPAIDTDTNIKILQDALPAQNKPDAKELILGVANAQRIYLTIKDLTDDALQKRLCVLSHAESDMPLSELMGVLAEYDNSGNISSFIDLVEKEVIKPNSGTNEMLAAMSHYGLTIAQRFYRECNSMESKRTARTYVLYFAAIETLALGAETNATLQAIYPEADNLNLDGGPTLTRTFESKEDLNKYTIKEIFNGSKVTPTTKLGGRYITTITPDSE